MSPLWLICLLLHFALGAPLAETATGKEPVTPDRTSRPWNQCEILSAHPFLRKDGGDFLFYLYGKFWTHNAQLTMAVCKRKNEEYKYGYLGWEGDHKLYQGADPVQNAWCRASGLCTGPDEPRSFTWDPDGTHILWDTRTQNLTELDSSSA